MAKEENSAGTLEATLASNNIKPGANDLDNSDSDDHFSDAQSGLESTPPYNSSLKVSSIDDAKASVISDNLKNLCIPSEQNNFIPGQQNFLPSPKVFDTFVQAFPTTLAENTDLSSYSSEKTSGAVSDENNPADIASEIAKNNSTCRQRSWSTRSRSGSTPGDRPIPITRVEKIDRRPSYGEIPGTLAYEFRKQDAIPDIIEEVEDIPDIKETFISTDDQNVIEEAHDGEFGNDFDDFEDFEEGEEDTEFGEFNENFQAAAPTRPLPYTVQENQPVLDFTIYNSQEEILAATESHLNALFPPDNLDNSVLSSVSNENSTFLTPRSASLWSQLVAPPPLQPPNWIQSRIRRLFLVSLGVPVDLDEILPASKQKKLILPSVNLNTISNSRRNSNDSHIESGLKKYEANISTTSLDSKCRQSRPEYGRMSRSKPAPEFDLVTARQLCVTTNEALNGFTHDEMMAHLEKLKKIEIRAKVVLEFWTERTDEKLRDRETFEGVIENLVKHARKIRK